MKVFLLFSISFSTLVGFTICEEHSRRADCDYGDPLILTPLIKCGRISVAREAARVHNWTSIESYSGFLTVNATHNSNMYFWFFPALKDPENAPVILWLQGGPGNPTFFGLFIEHGPFQFDNAQPGTINYRKHPWTETHSVIYMDNPIGTGFSYTDSDAGYANNMDDVSRDLYEALVQFFTLFSEFRIQDFFICGQSYAGKYVPAIAYYIHKKQERNLHRNSGVGETINLKGIFIGAPLIDPKSQLRYADFLYNIGLVDEHQQETVRKGDEELAQLIDSEKWEDAYLKFMEIMLGGSYSYVYRVSGYVFKYNLLEPDQPQYAAGEDVIAADWFRKAIHVGNLTHGDDGSVRLHLQEDIPKSTKYMVEELLNENYRVLLLACQLDVMVPAVGVEAVIYNMNWNGKQKYLDADRNIWTVKTKDLDEIAGFVKQADNLYHVLIRKAGHNSPYDQPEWSFDLINRFTRGKSFIET